MLTESTVNKCFNNSADIVTQVMIHRYTVAKTGLVESENNWFNVNWYWNHGN